MNTGNTRVYRRISFLTVMRLFTGRQPVALKFSVVALSQVEEHDAGILHGSLDGLQECDSLATVHQPVVVRQGDVHHGTDDDLSIPDDRSLKCPVHPQDGRLRWVDDRSAKERTKHSAITDGEGTTVHILNG